MAFLYYPGARQWLVTHTLTQQLKAGAYESTVRAQHDFPATLAPA